MLNTLDSSRSGPLKLTSSTGGPYTDKAIGLGHPPSRTEGDKIKAYVPGQEQDAIQDFENFKSYTKSLSINPDMQKAPLAINNRRNLFSKQYSFIQGDKTNLERISVD